MITLTGTELTLLKSLKRASSGDKDKWTVLQLHSGGYMWLDVTLRQAGAAGRSLAAKGLVRKHDGRPARWELSEAGYSELDLYVPRGEWTVRSAAHRLATIGKVTRLGEDAAEALIEEARGEASRTAEFKVASMITGRRGPVLGASCWWRITAEDGKPVIVQQFTERKPA